MLGYYAFFVKSSICRVARWRYRMLLYKLLSLFWRPCCLLEILFLRKVLWTKLADFWRSIRWALMITTQIQAQNGSTD